MRYGVIHIPNSFSWLPAGQGGEETRIKFRFSAAERRVFQKRRPIPVSQWAERHRVVTMGSLKGRWRNQVTPYMAGIMDASFFPSVQTVIICKAPQVGGSEAVNNCVGYAVDRDPGPVLYVYPDEMTAKENSRDRIQPMIESSRRLRSFLTGMQDDAAAMRINLQHMPIYMAWARSAARLANKPIKYLVFDETDKYPPTAGKKETDPISLGEKRTITYRWGRKIFKLSTPTIENGPITQALTTEAQVVFDYHVCCPECGEMQVMEFSGIKWPEGERDPERVETEGLARYECVACKALWNDHRRDVAVRWGEWRARGQRIEDRGQKEKKEITKTRKDPPSPEGYGAASEGLELSKYLKRYRPVKIGFHVPSWLSHFVSLSEVAAAFLKGLTDKTKLKDFKNNHEAVPWLDYAQERKEDEILALRDDRPQGMVPGDNQVACLTAGVDTQDDGFWYEIRAWGWGLARESWQIRCGFVDSFEALALILWEDEYKDPEENVFPVVLTLQDAMGHRTAEVYDFVRFHRRTYGRRVIPTQGVNSPRMVQIFNWSTQDTYPGTRKLIPGGIRLLRLKVNHFKDILSGKLEISPADPGAWHLSAETTLEYGRQMCSEFFNDETGTWEQIASRANHYWDCGVLNIAALFILEAWAKKPLSKEESFRPKAKPPEEPKWVPQKSGDWLKRR